jgi:hypothetical protein
LGAVTGHVCVYHLRPGIDAADQIVNGFESAFGQFHGGPLRTFSIVADHHDLFFKNKLLLSVNDLCQWKVFSTLNGSQ